MTWLSDIHPYPAMISNELARKLCAEFVTKSSAVLDPFCGSGRLIMSAAQSGASCVGIDINPLAILIARAKSVSVPPERIRQLVGLAERYRASGQGLNLDLEPGRKVDWFSASTKFELNHLIQWINEQKKTSEETVLLACVLSATVREVSFCRKGRWKLHRMNATDRSLFEVKPKEVFLKRLVRVAERMEATSKPVGNVWLELGNAKASDQIVRDMRIVDEPFDLILTSPPYGDSKTTVQYGAVSSLCLGVISHIIGLDTSFRSASDIDNACLGGMLRDEGLDVREHLKRYWRGSAEGERSGRVLSFLNDLSSSCQSLGRLVANQGRVVFVVGRRSVGGWRLYIDHFLIDVMTELGFELYSATERKIPQKITPSRVNRYGRSPEMLDRWRACVPTINSEHILVFVRT